MSKNILNLLASLLLAPLAALHAAETTAAQQIDQETLDKWSAPYRGWHYHPGHVIPANPLAPAQDIRSLMQRVNAWQLAHPRMKADDRNWERGTWYAGVTEAQRATGDDKFLQQALDWGNLHQWQVGTEGSGANKLFCAMTWAECYLLKRDPAMLKPTLDWLATDAPKSPGGAKVWFGHAPAPFDGPLYSDSLFAMPVFALLHQATGDRKHLDTLDHFARAVTAELFDKEEGLYYRDGTFPAQPRRTQAGSEGPRHRTAGNRQGTHGPA